MFNFCLHLVRTFVYYFSPDPDERKSLKGSENSPVKNPPSMSGKLVVEYIRRSETLDNVRGHSNNTCQYFILFYFIFLGGDRKSVT